MNQPRTFTPRRAPVRRLAAAASLVAGATLAAFASAPPAVDAASYPIPTLARRDATALPQDTARALALLDRATYGARSQDVDEVLRMGGAAWLDRQLHPERIDDSALDARLARFPAAGMSTAELYRAYPQPRQNPAAVARRDSLARAAGADPSANPRRRRVMPDSASMAPGMTMTPGASGEMRADASREMQADADGQMRPGAAGDAARVARRQRQEQGQGVAGPARIAFDLAGARMQRAVYSQRQLEAVMSDFWFNHFNVFFGKNADRYLVSDYERNAIRPHVFGRFEDLLSATAHHPAMLVYLDNWTSSVPDSSNAAAPRIEAMLRRWQGLSPEQRQAAVASGRVNARQAARLDAALAAGPAAVQQALRRPRGINENYARELMELHTLGVDGGYTQHDVVEVARAFTGWTMDRARPGAGGELDPKFVFRPAMHDRGEKTVLGHRLPAGRGEEDGREVLHILATSPATAHHVAFQLAQRFVADQPPAALVDRLAGVFLRTGGDLREVTRALFLSPEMADPRYRDGKVKTPVEFVASALRATGADVGPSRGLVQALRSFGEMPYLASPPTGYPNSTEQWTNSGAMLTRMNFALALTAGRLDGIRIDPTNVFPAGPPQRLGDAELRTLSTRLLAAAP
ncbi:MAG TPA: DUF1800 domain-containing protein, partial [Longimicrobiaceae bacterium]|nr:DUF1800 domain-containing protein [Longimicrobiaceae bacterium]